MTTSDGTLLSCSAMKVSEYFLSSLVLLGNIKTRKAREANLDPFIVQGDLEDTCKSNVYGTHCNEGPRLVRVVGKFRAVRGCLSMKRSKKRKS